ncbi:hypothetical protein ABFG93_16075 [Pseudalkalibacillus hwajinpoensis]|uniref:hypothetical protein n=1 Tax=Guptibacillus hwajinpoensis TaxID=208199 RepID=UPI00325B0BD3
MKKRKAFYINVLVVIIVVLVGCSVNAGVTDRKKAETLLAEGDLEGSFKFYEAAYEESEKEQDRYSTNIVGKLIEVSGLLDAQKTEAATYGLETAENMLSDQYENSEFKKQMKVLQSRLTEITRDVVLYNTRLVRARSLAELHLYDSAFDLLAKTEEELEGGTIISEGFNKLKVELLEEKLAYQNHRD